MLVRLFHLPLTPDMSWGVLWNVTLRYICGRLSSHFFFSISTNPSTYQPKTGPLMRAALRFSQPKLHMNQNIGRYGWEDPLGPIWYTPPKFNKDTKNHQKEIHFPNHHNFVSMLIFGGIIVYIGYLGRLHAIPSMPRFWSQKATSEDSFWLEPKKFGAHVSQENERVERESGDDHGL